MKTENTQAMLKDRINKLNKKLDSFNPVLYASPIDFNKDLDSQYRACTVAGYSFSPSKVLMLDNEAYYNAFKTWAQNLDLETIPEYAQILDERNELISCLEELS